MNKWDERFLNLAKLVSTWSKDPSTQVGAVIVDKNNRIISIGYNGFAKGVSDEIEDYQNRELKLSKIIHAEENAILFAKCDLSLTTLYTYPFMPCSSCSSKIIQVGITRVVSYKHDINSRWTESFKISQDQFLMSKIDLKVY